MTDFTSVGDGYRGIMEHAYRNFTDEKTGEMELFIFPVVAETFNGYLNDQSKFAVTPEHIIRGVNKATADRVPEATPEVKRQGYAIGIRAARDPAAERSMDTI